MKTVEKNEGQTTRKTLPGPKSVCYDCSHDMKINPPTVQILPFQLPICPALPTVYGNVDYTEFSDQLHWIDWDTAVAWHVLTHNLWVFSKLRKAEEEKEEEETRKAA